MGKIMTVNLPDIGEGVVEGEVVEWLKREGDAVGQDEPVVVVMTDKATVELPSPHPGKLGKQHVQPGKLAHLNKPLYDLEVEGGEAPKAKKKAPPPIEQRPFKEAPVPHAQAPVQAGAALATPPVRHAAKQLGIDISQVRGTGKEGRVTLDDLKRYHRPPATAIVRLPDDEEQPWVGVRGMMAEKMAASKRLAPHFSYFEAVDATRLLKLKARIKEQADTEGVHFTFMPLFIRALSLTIKQYPLINSSLDAEEKKLFIHKHHNVGIAVSTKAGLIVPVMKNVESMGIEELARAFDVLKEKALSKTLQPAEMKGSTITISNYGVVGGGGLWATPVLNYPEVAILAVNRIKKQPVVSEEKIVVKDVLNLSWSFDHRVIDGDMAAKVSRFFASLIHNPAQLL